MPAESLPTRGAIVVIRIYSVVTFGSRETFPGSLSSGTSLPSTYLPSYLDHSHLESIYCRRHGTVDPCSTTNLEESTYC